MLDLKINSGCPAGYYANPITGYTCDPCPPGTFSEDGSINCTLCPAGTANAATGKNMMHLFCIPIHCPRSAIMSTLWSRKYQHRRISVLHSLPVWIHCSWWRQHTMWTMSTWNFHVFSWRFCLHSMSRLLFQRWCELSWAVPFTRIKNNIQQLNIIGDNNKCLWRSLGLRWNSCIHRCYVQKKNKTWLRIFTWTTKRVWFFDYILLTIRFRSIQWDAQAPIVKVVEVLEEIGSGEFTPSAY